MATQFLSATNRIYRVETEADVAGTITPDCDTADLVLSTLDTNSTMANPAGTPHDGQRLSFRITQDGTGGRTLAWGSEYIFVRTAAHYLDDAANAISTYEFQYHAGDDEWRHLPNASWGVSWGVQGYAQTNTLVDEIPSDGVGTIILLLEDIQVKAGRAYQIIGHGEIESDTAVPSRSESHIKYTTDGSTPDASDPNLTRQLNDLTTLDVPGTVHMVSIYRPATDHALSVAIHAQGVFNASHEYTFYADANTPIYLSIEDVGPNPG
jgi:hypothetical protein